MSSLAQQDFSNTTIRRFDIARLIARGGMGEVYLARDAVLGRDLALKINVPSGAGQLTLVTMPLDGSGPPRDLGTIAPATANGLLEWTANGEGLLYSTVERANVWLQRLSGGPPVKITNFTDLGIVRGRRAPDGRSLIVARGAAQTDAYLVSNFK